MKIINRNGDKPDVVTGSKPSRLLWGIAILLALTNCHMNNKKTLCGRHFKPEIYFQGQLLPIAQSIYEGDTALVAHIDPGLINQLSERGICLLIYAIHVCNERAMEILLEKGADPNIYCEVRYHLASRPIPVTPLNSAASNLNSLISAVKTLLKYGADINDNRANPALLHAILREDREMVDLLLDNGAEVNIQQKTTKESPLIKAADIFDYDMVNHLLDRGANPTLRDVSGVNLAYIVQYEIQNGRGTDKYKKTLQELKQRLESMGVQFPVERIPPLSTLCIHLLI